MRQILSSAISPPMVSNWNRHALIRTAIALFSVAHAQQIGHEPEFHPRFITYKCTNEHGCQPQNTSLVLDFAWRNILDIHTGESCLTPSFELNKTTCPTAAECAKNCALEGVNYKETGVETFMDGHSVTLQMYHQIEGSLTEVAPQVYLLNESTSDYVLFQLLGQEVSFDVDISQAPCGIDAAFWITEMEASGGRGKLNPAGADYGTGYCDSQCDTTSPFINGVANVHQLGACCNEFDLMEANSRATQFTAHPCNITRLYECSGRACDWHNGVCDRSGCPFNPYGLGNHSFYGVHKSVDTSKPFKVITRFPTTRHGALKEIRRLYVQDDKLIQNAMVSLSDSRFTSMSTAFCDAIASQFAGRGGLPLMGQALKRGMVGVLGLWNDRGGNNNWLDAGSAGPCSTTAGRPKNIKANSPGTAITFSNIKWGDIGSTYKS